MEKLKECITEELKDNFKKVISYSQNVSYDCLNVDNIFTQWAANKEKLFHLFGNQLIKNCGNVKINLPNDVKEDKLNTFLDFLLNNTFRICKTTLISLCDPVFSDVYGNKIKFDIKLDDGRVIPKGMKLSRAFSYFIEDKSLLTYIQNQYSVFLQDLKMEGELCLSIHPLDFLSVSENNSGWRSCHSLDGDYRAGNLAYMGDNCTFIAYIKTSNDTYITRFGNTTWNNKIWRCLFFLNEDNTVLFAGRQYPRNLELEPLHYILDILNIDGLKEWKHSSEIYQLIDHVTSANNLFYNDLLHSTYYTDPYVSTVYKDSSQMHEFTIGSDIDCLICGKPIYNGYSMFCDRHETKRLICDYCGDPTNEDEVEYVEGYGYVCRYCLENNFSTCDKCGKICSNDDLYWDEETGMYYCEDCQQDG